MANARVTRGRQTQVLLAQPDPQEGPLGWYNLHGWENATSRPASEPGKDIMRMLGLAPEVKATAEENFTGALKQAHVNANGELAFVVYRPKGYGPEKIGLWLVAMRLEDHTQLLKDAGYGA